MNSPTIKKLTILSVFIIPVLLIVFAIIYKVDEGFYMFLTEEDHLVEWTTAVCLLITAVLSGILFFRRRRQASRYAWFFVLFAVACVLFALEEVSWGQRVMGVESTEFFLEHSDQKEINVHNVLQKRFYFKTKHVAARVLFYFGTVLPILALDRRIRRLIRKTRIVIPHVSLALGFFIAALMMWDKPTGREEELGELFFSLCFVLFMVWNFVSDYADMRDTPSS